MSNLLSHLSSDEDTEEEGKATNPTHSPNRGDNPNPVPGEPVEVLLKTKRPRYNKPFTEELLVSPAGPSCNQISSTGI
jgi:hypothetical protein